MYNSSRGRDELYIVHGLYTNHSFKKSLTTSSALAKSPPTIHTIRLSFRNHVNCLLVKSWMAYFNLSTISSSLLNSPLNHRLINRYSNPIASHRSLLTPSSNTLSTSCTL